jgi:hypothetical protein
MMSILVNGTPTIDGLSPLRGIEVALKPSDGVPAFYFFNVGMLPMLNFSVTEAVEASTDYLIEYDLDSIDSGNVRITIGGVYTANESTTGPKSETVTTDNTGDPGLRGATGTVAVVRNVTITKL